MDDKNLINGNTALNPKRKSYYPSKEEEYEKQKRENDKRRKASIEKRAEKKAKIIKYIFATFIIGVILICRYSTVYKLQKNLLDVKYQIHNLNMENESLKVQLIKASDMEKVEEIAKTKLNMVTPDKNNIMYVENTKDYFAKDTKENVKNKNEDLIIKIKNMLF